MNRVALIGGNEPERLAISDGLESEGLQVVASGAEWSTIAGSLDLDAVIVVNGATGSEIGQVLAAAADLAIILMTDATGLDSLMRAHRAGWAVLPPGLSPSTIAAAVETSVAGLVTLPSRNGAGIGESFTTDDGDTRSVRDGVAAEALTRRERDVLGLLADGLSNRAIAARLAISEHTVKFHVSTIYGKLGAVNRADAVARAWQRGLITV